MINIETRVFKDVDYRQTNHKPMRKECSTTIDQISVTMPRIVEPEYGQRWVVDVTLRLQEGS